MNDHDRGNLNFLLNITSEVFDDWMDQADIDDIDYALELLAMHKSELVVGMLELKDNVEDTTQANEILKKFMLKDSK